MGTEVRKFAPLKGLVARGKRPETSKAFVVLGGTNRKNVKWLDDAPYTTYNKVYN